MRWSEFRGFSLTLAALCLAGLFGSGTSYGDQIRNAPVGTKIQGIADISGHQVPLPPGEWVIAARRTVMSSGMGRAVRLVNIYLVQFENNELTGYVFINTNLDGSSGGWSRDSNICDRDDKHVAYSDRNYNPRDITCWHINNIGFTPAPNSSEFYKEFYRYSVDVKKPTTIMAVSFVLVRGFEVMNVVYGYNPAAANVRPAPLTGSWAIESVQKDAKKKNYVAQLKRDAEAIVTKLDKGLSGNLN